MVDPDLLARHLDLVLEDATIPELPHHYRGKVRDNYDLPDGPDGPRRIIIATDRLSAFDRNIAAIPLKGQVLTPIARFWFDRTADDILARGLLTPARWREVSERAFALFARGRDIAAERRLILVDTKYEFGVDRGGHIVLADEIHTPDSSRYWSAETYPRRFAAGEPPDSFDKDFLRRWVAARCDPYRDPIPPIPPEIICEAARIYI